MAPVAVLLSSIHCFHSSNAVYHMDTAQPSELACLPQEPQSHNRDGVGPPLFEALISI